MTYPTLFEANKTSIMGIWSYANEASGYALTPFILFALAVITLSTTYYSQLRARGYGDFLGCFAVTGIFIGIVAFVMNLSTEVIIDPVTTLICITVGFVGVGILLFQNAND